MTGEHNDYLAERSTDSTGVVIYWQGRNVIRLLCDCGHRLAGRVAMKEQGRMADHMAGRV